MHQFLYFGIKIIENSVYFLGEYIFSNLMGPIMDQQLNHYMFEFPYPSIIRGQQTWDGFILDYRNTKSPYISDKGYIDLFFSGELVY